MNTLKYKVLLIKKGLLIFIRSIGIYLLLTIPAAAALPLMYLISAGYALSFGWIAAGLFLLVLYLLKALTVDVSVKKIILFTSVPVAVAVAFQAMEFTGAQYNIWHSGIFLMFPAAAVVAGWISLLVQYDSIAPLLTAKDMSNAPSTADSISCTTDNIFK